MIGSAISTIWKGDSYNSILIIINRLTKIVHYKLIKINIYVSRLLEIIIDIIVKHHGFLDLIMINKSFLFTLKLWSLFYYFLALSDASLPHFILKLTIKWNSKTTLWKFIFELLSILSRIIKLDFYWWLNWYTIMPKTPMGVIHFLS